MSIAEDLPVKALPRLESPLVEIVIPVYNEAHNLEASVGGLRSYLDESFPFSALVTIVDNASTDATWQIAQRLAGLLPGVQALHLDQKGKGRAVRAAWSRSEAKIVAYMDVDLSTELDALLPLVAPLLSGHSDVAIGSRLARGAHVVRGPKREVISRCYNMLLRIALKNQISDATCGFKALRRSTAEVLLPLVEDDYWFFDTELLVLAERNGLRIHEVPVDWTDDPDSRVDITGTALHDLKGVWRLLTRMATGRSQPCIAHDARAKDGDLAHFAGVGAVTIVAFFACFLLTQGSVGTYLADWLSLAICTAASALAHARYTHGFQRSGGWRNAAVGGLASLTVSLVFTTSAIGVARAMGTYSLNATLMALALATAVGAGVRFVLFRAWSFYLSAGTPDHADTLNRTKQHWAKAPDVVMDVEIGARHARP